MNTTEYIYRIPPFDFEVKEASTINNNSYLIKPPAYKGWKFVIIVVAVLVLLGFAGCLYLGYRWGRHDGKADSATYFVSSTGKVHNNSCLHFREIPDAKNCKICGGTSK